MGFKNVRIEINQFILKNCLTVLPGQPEGGAVSGCGLGLERCAAAGRHDTRPWRTRSGRPSKVSRKFIFIPVFIVQHTDELFFI